MEDLVRNEIGVNEVEREAWNRAANRAVKKGLRRPVEKGKYSKEFQRDRTYIGRQMKIRAQQAKEDWWEQRRVFIKMKDRLVGSATSPKEKNKIKRNRKHQEG